MLIHDATEEDLAAIVAIYNDVIATSTAVFSEEPVTVEERREWLRAHRRRGAPVIVARAEGEVVGFATYGAFRPWPGYHSTVEHSVHVAAGHRRRGIGGALLEDIVQRARQAGMHVIVAGIDAENRASLRLHQQLGFAPVGTLPEVARKFGRWVDLSLLLLHLEAAQPAQSVR
jgi:L-amino acid N-acyltransferase YncA